MSQAALRDGVGGRPSRPRLLGRMLLLAIALGEAGCARSASPASGCAGPAPPPDRAGYEAEVVRLVNAERRRAGLAPLKRSEPLSEAARYFAHDMAEDDYFVSHDSHDRVRGRLVRRCDFRARVRSYEPSWRALGENIASGHETPGEAVAGWLASPRHRANLLGAGFRETGAGFAEGGSHGSYWVQDFGRRNAVFPLLIDDDAASARSPDVRLFVHGSWSEMRLRNDDGPFTPWRPFSGELAWRLAEQPGTRRVTVELRAGGRRAAASDTIELVD